MPRSLSSRLLVLCLACLALARAPRASSPAPAWLAVSPPPVPDHLVNAWPEAWETEFRARARQTIAWYAQRLERGNYGTTWFESEKQSYPNALFDLLAGQQTRALAYLQSEDAMPADHAHTAGIDLYPCFTLKGQVRKYFLLRDLLDPAYRERMFGGARAWTERDPLHRPHPVHGTGTGGEGWTPEVRGGWVDARNTDNLRAMRDTAIYLFAEETGNEATRLVARQRLLDYTLGLYSVGMSEWDSENYHGHAVAAWHNLYDFAVAPDVRGIAKAALDWLYAAAALKYWRGGFGGPNCRDYGGASVVYGSGAARTLDLAFGDTLVANPDPERDQVHLITSRYRPPAAVVALARKDFPRPITVTSTKPDYRTWKPGDDPRPRYHETAWFGRTFQMASIVAATPEITWNVSPFKLMAVHPGRGVDFFVVNTSPLDEHARKNAGDQIAQHRNLLLWLRPARPAATFHFLLPRTAVRSTERGVEVIRLATTTLLLHPLNLGPLEPAAPGSRRAALYAGETFLEARTTGEGFAGFALEVRDPLTPEDLPSLGAPSRQVGRLAREDLASGDLELVGLDRHRLRLVHNPANDLPRVWRDGIAVDWSRPAPVYASDRDDGPIHQDGQGRRLRVRAGGHTFESFIAPDGSTRFVSQ